LLRKRNKRKHRVEARAGSEWGCVVNSPPLQDEPAPTGSRLSAWRGAPSGEDLQEAIVVEERLVVCVQERVDEERAKLARFKALFERRHELHEELNQLRRERIQAEQKARSLEQRIERERRRTERLVRSADGSRRGRAARIEVDNEAWATLKRAAVRRQQWLVWWIGDLVRVEVDALAAGLVTGRPSSRRRRSPGEDDPQPRQSFLRIDVDDEHWTALRAAALGTGITAGRYVGELAEATAYESGWRSAPPLSG
jgi:hypothetical protein